MSKFFYFQLAWSNIKKNKKMYFPYILTCTVTVAMYYLIHSLAGNEGFGSGTVRAVLGLSLIHILPLKSAERDPTASGIRIEIIRAALFLIFM